MIKTKINDSVAYRLRRVQISYLEVSRRVSPSEEAGVDRVNHLDRSQSMYDEISHGSDAPAY